MRDSETIGRGSSEGALGQRTESRAFSKGESMENVLNNFEYGIREKDQIQAYIKLSSPVSFKTETVERLKDLELKKIQVREERKLELDFVKNVSVSNLNERKSNE